MLSLCCLLGFLPPPRPCPYPCSIFYTLSLSCHIDTHAHLHTTHKRARAFFPACFPTTQLISLHLLLPPVPPTPDITRPHTRTHPITRMHTRSKLMYHRMNKSLDLDDGEKRVILLTPRLACDQFRTTIFTSCIVSSCEAVDTKSLVRSTSRATSK